MTTPRSLDLQTLRAAYADGADPRDVIRACLDRLAAIDDPGIFVTLSDGAALDAAVGRLGPFDPDKKPLWGVPFAIKDNIDLAAVPTTAGCPGFAFTPERSATVVSRLVAAGAVPLGKTNLDQFATGLVGVRTPYPVPRNAFDPAIVPGGSSSGSAVATAQGVVSFALGTDTAGSGRVPAGLNNLVGLKPSLGAIPLTGVLPACQSLDCVSIFALTVPDAAAVLDVVAGYDEADPWSRRRPLVRPADAQRPRRVGVPDRASRIFLGDRDSEAAFDAGLAVLDRLGCTLEPTDLEPFFAVARLLYEGSWVAERYQAIRPFIEGRPDEVHPTTRGIIEQARLFSAADAFRDMYQLAALRRVAEAVWARIDVLAVPTYPRPVRRAELDRDPVGPNSGLGTYTNFVNLLDLCALAVPGPFRRDGFPSGITLVAPGGQDGTLAALGAPFHAASGAPLGLTGTSVPEPAFPPASGEAGGIEIAVVGAHLSGMALNGELLKLGGRLVRPSTTTTDYRLHALTGGPPHRPGLVRAAKGSGAAIALEVWSLPPDGFGRFVASIPAPLGIGTVLLEDGTTVKGFLCESVGLAGSSDITSYGGWRAYLDAQADADA